MSAFFYFVDLAVGFGLPVVIHVYHSSSELDHSVRALFWLGVGVGLLWEIPIFVSATFASSPVIAFINPPPVPPLVLMACHALWDGGLFLGGVLLLRLLFGDGTLRRFRWAQLLVFVLWGQGSALMVEAGSLAAGAWAYVIPFGRNFTLFQVRGYPVTVLPQLIWFAAPVLYYLVAVWLVRHRRAAMSGK